MKSVCLISYFPTSYKGVASLRTGYWFRNLKNLSHGRYCVDLISHETVPPLFTTSLDQGIAWLIPLYFFLLRNKKSYDVYIFSGGPFVQFILAIWVKLILRKKVILDYRDPFAINPDFNDSFIKKRLKLLLELCFSFYADNIITVNSFCADLIQHPPGKALKIIENGYDETITPDPTLHSETNISLILTGRYSLGYNSQTLNDVQILKEALENNSTQWTLYHCGINELPMHSKNYKYLGLLNYSKTLSLIQATDICILFSGGNPYESTTKIYDYLRFNKKVLVISRNPEGTGALKETTIKLPNVLWVENSPIAISDGLETLRMRPNASHLNYTEDFSRKNGTLKLIKILDELI